MLLAEDICARSRSSGPAMKGRGDGTTGVPRSGNQDAQRAVAGTRYARQARSQESRAEILEGCSGTMEQLQHAQAVGGGQLLQRGRKTEGIARDLRDLRCKGVSI